MVLNIWRCALIGTVLFTPLCGLAKERPNLEAIELTDTAVKRLRELGKINVSGGSADHEIDLGSHFPGKIHQGRVTIINDTDETVSVGQIVSSCGCTLAQSSDEKILPGQSQYLLIQVNKNAPGSFGERVDVRIGGRTHQLMIEGKIAPRLSSDEVIEFDEIGRSTLKLVVHDDKLDRESIRFQIAGSAVEIASQIVTKDGVELTLVRQDLARFENGLTLIPAATMDGSPLDFSPIVFQVKYHGVVRTVPGTAYYSKGKAIRLFLIGDVDSIISRAGEGGDKLEIKMHVSQEGKQPEDLDVVATVKPMKGTVSLTFQKDFPKGNYDVSASCADINFRFEVNSLEE